MKTLKYFLFLLPLLFLTACGGWELEKNQTEWFSIEIPKGATIESHQDDYGIYASIKNTTNTDIDIEILPVEVPLQKAYDIIGKYYSHNRIISKMSSDTTHFYWDNAQGIKEDISNELLRCETYCFHKSGFTVVISSYGIKQDYISIKDIASSIEMTSKPYDEEQMKKLISQYEKDAPVEAKKAIQKMLPPGYECKDANLINHGEHYTMECTLTGNFSYSELLPLSQNTSKINALQTMLSYTSFGPYTVYAPHIMKAELYGLKTFLLFVDTKGQRIEFKR